MAEEPKPVPPEVIEAIKQGNFIVCYVKCWPCQFGDHTDEPHTWMDADDIVHAKLVTPTTPEGWAALGKSNPCGCHCMEPHRAAARP